MLVLALLFGSDLYSMVKVPVQVILCLAVSCHTDKYANPPSGSSVRNERTSNEEPVDILQYELISLQICFTG